MFRNIATGFRLTAQNKKMIGIVYLINVLFGLLMMLPWRAAISSFGGHSLLMRNMGGAFNMDFLFDLVIHQPTFLSIWITVIAAGLLLYQLVQLFLSGGIFSVYLGDGVYDPAVFWGSASRYFWRFVRLALWSLLILGLFVGIVFAFKELQRLIWGKHPYETVLYWNKVFRIVLLQFLLMLYAMILDYSRMVIIRDDVRRSRQALLAGIRFVQQQFWPALGIALSFFILTGLTLLIYNIVADVLKSPSIVVIVLLFLWQQAYMLIRLVFRLSLYGAESALFRTRSG